MPSSVCWFEIPADDVGRARKFYNKLFGWKMNKMPNPNMEYWHMDTGGADASPDGAIMQRQCPEHQGYTNYVFVASVDKAAAKVEKLGGKIMKPKTAVPGMGHFVICMDTENNAFALWQLDKEAQ